MLWRILACSLAAAWPVGGCGSTSEPATGDARVDILSTDPRIRILATRAAAEEQRGDMTDVLTMALGDPDPAVRMFADIALRKLTGRDFDYKPYGTVSERAAAQELWAQYFAEAKAVGKRPESETDGTGRQD